MHKYRFLQSRQSIEKQKKSRRNHLPVIPALPMFFLCSLLVFCVGCQSSRQEKNQAAEKTTVSESSVTQKGYNLPVSSEEEAIAKKDCQEKLSLLKDLYLSIDKGDFANIVLSNKDEIALIQKLSAVGAPVLPSDTLVCNTKNPEKLESFLTDCLSQKKGELVVYVINTSGELERRQFSFDGKDMYLLSTRANFDTSEKVQAGDSSLSRLAQWEYTKKGWFIYEMCVPQPPDVSEEICGYVMVKVTPVKKKYRKICQNYLTPVGYQTNNLFLTDWDSEHIDHIDFTGLYAPFYYESHHQAYSGTSTNNSASDLVSGIPAAEFEKEITAYLPITAADLRKSQKGTSYHKKTNSYDWSLQGCGNYTPDAFGTSIPEITKITKNDDGSQTFTIDAVCEMLGNEAALTHELTVRFVKNGAIRYLKNHVVKTTLDVPEYRYRIPQ